MYTVGSINECIPLVLELHYNLIFPIKESKGATEYLKQEQSNAGVITSHNSLSPKYIPNLHIHIT